MLTQYRKGEIPRKEVIKRFSQLVSPTLFQISHMMSGLDMAWTIDGSGISINLGVDVPWKKEKLEVRMYLDDTDMVQRPYFCLLEKRMPESEEFQIFFDLLGEKGILIDIGANIGWYSLFGAYYGAQVYSFEPIPRTYQRLCDNIRLNELTNVKTFNIGLGGEAGIDTFYFQKYASGASSRVDLDYLADGSAQKNDCPMDTLDNICSKEKIEQVSLIKCDVEGGELFAFQGAIETIRRFRPFVLSEMLRKWSAKFNYHPDDIIRFFCRIGL